MEDTDELKKQPPNNREKWEVEASFREREISVREREQRAREAELELKRKEGWRSPLVLALLAAAIAATGNAAVAWINGTQQRNLERTKAEDARILEMVGTGNQDSAAENLRFLLDAGLILNAETKVSLRKFLERRKAGTGPALPAANPVRPAPYQIFQSFIRYVISGNGGTLLTWPENWHEMSINELAPKLLDPAAPGLNLSQLKSGMRDYAGVFSSIPVSDEEPLKNFLSKD